jgi:MFS family permease
MVLFCIFTAVLALSPSYAVAVGALLGVGVALGCDYPTAHLIISESIPSRIRGRMVLAAFGFQAVGGLAGTAVGFLILFENADIGAWRWIYASTLVLAVPVTIGRCFIVQSPLWLMFRGRIEEAQAATQRLLLRAPPYPKKVILHRLQVGDKRDYPERASWSALFRGTNLRRTLLASVPWFLQDLGTYGIGIFTPTILATLIGASIDHPRNTAELIQRWRRKETFIDVLVVGSRARAAHRPVDASVCRFSGSSAPLLSRRSLDVGGTLAACSSLPIHGVQLHDQYRPERHDLSHRWRGFDPRSARLAASSNRRV